MCCRRSCDDNNTDPVDPCETVLQTKRMIREWLSLLYSEEIILCSQEIKMLRLLSTQTTDPYSYRHLHQRIQQLQHKVEERQTEISR